MGSVGAMSLAGAKAGQSCGASQAGLGASTRVREPHRQPSQSGGGRGRAGPRAVGGREHYTSSSCVPSPGHNAWCAVGAQQRFTEGR